MKMNPEPIVTVIRPNLTPEERKKRIAHDVTPCMIDFWNAKMRNEKEERNGD